MTTPPRTTAKEKSRRTMTVFLLRHGERLDEANRRSHRGPKHPGGDVASTSREDSLDPPLTLRGYQQAVGAWEALLRAISQAPRTADDDDDRMMDRPHKNLSIFTSPLRRAVGTTLALEAAQQMLGDKILPPLTSQGHSHSHGDRRTADPHKRHKYCRKQLHFDDPDDDQVPDPSRPQDTSSRPARNEPKQSSGSAETATFEPAASGTNNPKAVAVILNGLSDCAAQVTALGGVGEVLRTWPNLLPCADAPVQRSTRALTKELHEMRAQLSQACPSGEEVTLEFCRVDDTAAAVRYVPMNANTHDPARNSTLVSNRSVHYESFLRAVDRAVMLTASSRKDCDRVVMVGHREGIRELVRERCRRGRADDHHRIHTFYCCIAVFTVVVDFKDSHSSEASSAGESPEDSPAPLLTNWTFHGCHDYQSFDASCLPP